MSPLEAAEFLRALADKFAQGQMEFGEVQVELDQTFKVRQSIKTKADKVCFKLKLKYEKPLLFAGGQAGGTHPVLALDLDDDDDQGGQVLPRPSFKHLKKAMGKAFKQIRQSLEEGRLPDLPLSKSFWSQCQLMTTYPGRGEEYYLDFTALADRFLDAIERGVLEEARQAVEALAAMKKSCHASHD